MFKTGNTPFRFTFLPLTKGVATIIEAPGGMTILSGTGHKEDASAVLAALRKRGTRKVDVILVDTWTDAVAGGGLSLINRMPVRSVVHNADFFRTPDLNGFYQRIEQLDKARKMRISIPSPGELMTVHYSPPCQMRAVAPTGPMMQKFARDPDNSVMTEFSYDRTSVLFLGQSRTKHQREMWRTAQQRPDAQALVIGRDGSADSLDPALLKSLKPKVAVIPVRARGGGGPAPAVLQALSRAKVRVYRTDRDGVVTLTTDGRDMKVSTDR